MLSFEELLTQLQPNLVQIEAARINFRKHRKSGRIYIAVTVACTIALALVGFQFHPLASIAVVIAGLILVSVLYQSYISKSFKQFQSDFKQLFVQPLLGSLAEDVRYVPTGDSSILAEYQASQLYPQTVDRSHIQDTVFCRMGATEIKFSELHTEYKTTTTDSKGRRTTHWHTIFRGLFVSADFNKTFVGTTYVRTDVAEKTFGLMGRMLQKPIFSSLELVQLEDPDFEREFVVRSSDQIEARYILSPALMSRMLALKNRFAADIEFAFVGSRVFIAISTNEDFFEPDHRKSASHEGYLQQFAEQARLCLGIVEDLGLNVRIWSKQ